MKKQLSASKSLHLPREARGEEAGAGRGGVTYSMVTTLGLNMAAELGRKSRLLSSGLGPSRWHWAVLCGSEAFCFFLEIGLRLAPHLFLSPCAVLLHAGTMCPLTLVGRRRGPCESKVIWGGNGREDSVGTGCTGGESEIGPETEL